MQTGLCLSSYVSRQCDTARICCWVPCCGAAAARRLAAATVDWYLLPALCSAANLPHAASAVKWWDRQTNGQTDAQSLHRPCSAYYASSVSRHQKWENYSERLSELCVLYLLISGLALSKHQKLGWHIYIYIIDYAKIPVFDMYQL